MRLTPIQFIWRFDSECKDQQNAVFEDLIVRSIAGQGGTSAIAILVGTQTIELMARVDVRNHEVLQTLRRALIDRTATFRTGCWLADGAAQIGMVCHVGSEIVALMSAREVVRITINREKFDLTIDDSI